MKVRIPKLALPNTGCSRSALATAEQFFPEVANLDRSQAQARGQEANKQVRTVGK
ncbi:MAG: hypothetical protein ACREQA_06265 [Candidatus Binatia bacterium]